MWHQKTKMDKFTNFCTSVPWNKWDVPQVRRKCLQILLSDKGLVLRRDNKLLQLRNKKTTQLINGQKPWIEGSYPVVNKHEKRGSASLVIRATQNKTIGDPAQPLDGRNQQDRQDREWLRRRNWSLRSVGSHFEKQLVSFFRREMYHITPPHPPGVSSREWKTYIPMETWMQMFPAVLIPDNPQLDAIQMSIIRWLDKTQWNTDKMLQSGWVSKKMTLSGKSLNAEECRVYDFIRVKCAAKAKWGRERADRWFPGLGGGRGDPLRMRLGEVFEVMGGPETRLWWWLHNSVIY